MPELFVTNGNAAPPCDANRLFRNLGGGVFADVAGAAGVAGGSACFAGPLLFDYDGDADLDILVYGTAAGSCSLFRNDGALRFTDVTAASGLTALALSSVQAAAAGDLDNDGDLDLVIMRTKSLGMILRNTNGVFQDISANTYIPVESVLFRGVALGDLDADGCLDIYMVVSNTATYPGGRLYRNDCPAVAASPYPTYTDASVATMKEATAWKGVAIGDLTGDGNLDVIVANTLTYPGVWYNTRVGDGTTYVVVRPWLLSRARYSGIGAAVSLWNVANAASPVFKGVRVVGGGGGFASQGLIEVYFGGLYSFEPYIVRVTFPSFSSGSVNASFSNLGAQTAPAGRTLSVYPNVCGDGYRSGPAEWCDDGNLLAGDGCNAACLPERGHACTGGSLTSRDNCFRADRKSVV